MLLRVLKFISNLKLETLYKVSSVLHFIGYRLLKYRTAVVRQNIERSFPLLSSEERTAIERKFYKHFFNLFAEIIYVGGMSDSELEQRVTVRNPELLQKYKDANRSVVGVMGHYGNWEWCGHALTRVVKMNYLAVYKTLSNKSFDQYMRESRTRFGINLIPKNDTFKGILKYRRESTCILLIADQSPTREESDTWVDFLNQKTLVLEGPEKLATGLDYGVIYIEMLSKGRGNYELVLHEITDQAKTADPKWITQQHVKFLEQTIKADPAYWLWSHRRWKHQP